MEIMLCEHKINREDGGTLITAWLPAYELLKPKTDPG